MGERSDQIEEHINRTREDLRDNLNELEEKVRSAFDWRMQFEEHPFTMLSLALGGGMLAAALIPTGRKQGNGNKYYAGSVGRNVRNTSDKADSTAGETTRGSFDAFKGAFLTTVASRIGGFLGDLLSGYRHGKHKPDERYSAI